MKHNDYNNNVLDIFRLIATAQVFLGHIISHFAMPNAPVNAVYFVRGVPILFVLCGFLAAKSISKYSPLEWLKGRAARILPGFWACILVNTIIILCVYETKPTVLEGIIYGVTQFFGMNFYTGEWLRGYGVGVPNGVLWTIPVQIQFFVLVPLLHRFLKTSSVRKAGILVGILTVLSIAIEWSAAILPEIVTKLIGVTVFPYLYFLVAGMVGWYHRDAIIPKLQKVKWYILLAYVFWKLAEDHLQFPHIFDGVMYNTVTTLLMAAVIFACGFGHTWRMRRDYTFGFYLYHMVFVNLAVHFGFTTFSSVWNGAIILLVISVMTLICAWISMNFIENPAAKLLKKRG